MNPRSFGSRFLFGAAALVPLACSNDTKQSTAATSDAGTTIPPGDSGGPSFDFGDGAASDGAPETTDTLTMTVRDFKLYSASDGATDPDFENVPHTDANGKPSTTYAGPWDDKAIVTDALGDDGKPVYKNPAGTTLTTHGKEAFDEWYRDVAKTNVKVEVPLKLTTNGDGSYEYDSQKSGVPLTGGGKGFFPIDDGSPYATELGNQSDPHNYSFTVELHTTFTYKGGEFFHFRGDDDVFVYVDKKLVINLGGIHGPEEADVNADSLGLTKGKDYALDFFSAERHKTGSNILFTTTLDLRPVVR